MAVVFEDGRLGREDMVTGVVGISTEGAQEMQKGGFEFHELGRRSG